MTYLSIKIFERIEPKSINNFVKRLEPEDYEIDEKDRTVILTNTGTDKIENILVKISVLSRGLIKMMHTFYPTYT